MKITLLCSSTAHPINAYLEEWIVRHEPSHEINRIQSKCDLTHGDLLFLISCSEIVSADDRDKYTNTLVIHASNLPQGRGWSPHIWQILEGLTEITVSLIEAEDKVDCGDIWHQIIVEIPKHALWDEINHAIFEAEMKLMDFCIENSGAIHTRPQSSDITPTYFRRRSPADSAVDPRKTIEEQFNLIRVSDPDRFPAFFELYGKRYLLRLEKA
jgi:methionyl-tRNA formyltransferase